MELFSWLAVCVSARKSHAEEFRSGVKIKNNRIFSLLFLPKIHALDGCAAVLPAPSGDVYYHWLFDLLPRLEILRRCDVSLDSIDFFVVNGRSRQFQSEILSKMKVAEPFFAELHPVSAEE